MGKSLPRSLFAKPSHDDDEAYAPIWLVTKETMLSAVEITNNREVGCM